MALHLNEISKLTPEGRHAGVLIDNAGYHRSKELPQFDNLTLIPLPPYSPEINSAEEIWERLRAQDLSNYVFKNCEDIINKCCEEWNELLSEVGRLKSLCARSWAVIS